MKGVILTGGRAAESLRQIYGDIATGMIPVNGKPVIAHIIQSYFEMGINEIYIAIGYKGENVIEMVKASFPMSESAFRFIAVDFHRGPGSSLMSVLEKISEGSVVINLADTIVGDLSNQLKVTSNRNIVVTSDKVNETDRWCTVQIDSARKIIQFFEKGDTDIPVEIVVGVYVLADIRKLCEESVLLRLINENDLQISDVLKLYSTIYPLLAVCTEKWMDFGHIDTYQISKKRLLEARHFNSLEFDDLLGTITKKSTNIEKFVSEINFQLNLPKNLEVLFPRIIDYSVDGNSPFLKMEYYGYPTVAESWIYSSLSFSNFKSLLQKLFTVLQTFTSYQGHVQKEAYQEMYVTKTNERIKALADTDIYFKQLLEVDTLTVNGVVLRNWNLIKAEVIERIDSLYIQDHNSIIHGDFCFSNILFDISSGIVRLLDPRGNWGGTIHGDIKYDVAKLRHSVAGSYDFIVNDCFFCSYSGASINYRIPLKEHHFKAIKYFDTLISTMYNLDQIKLIEGLLFLSMIPYHAGQTKRQTVMYSKGVELLNEVVAIPA